MLCSSNFLLHSSTVGFKCLYTLYKAIPPATAAVRPNTTGFIFNAPKAASKPAVAVSAPLKAVIAALIFLIRPTRPATFSVSAIAAVNLAIPLATKLNPV